MHGQFHTLSRTLLRDYHLFHAQREHSTPLGVRNRAFSLARHLVIQKSELLMKKHHPMPVSEGEGALNPVDKLTSQACFWGMATHRCSACGLYGPTEPRPRRPQGVQDSVPSFEGFVSVCGSCRYPYLRAVISRCLVSYPSFNSSSSWSGIPKLKKFSRPRAGLDIGGTSSCCIEVTSSGIHAKTRNHRSTAHRTYQPPVPHRPKQPSLHCGGAWGQY